MLEVTFDWLEEQAMELFNEIERRMREKKRSGNIHIKAKNKQRVET